MLSALRRKAVIGIAFRYRRNLLGSAELASGAIIMLLYQGDFFQLSKSRTNGQSVIYTAQTIPSEPVRTHPSCQ